MAKTPKDYNSDYMSRKMDEQLEQIENNLSALYANASYEVNAEWKRFSDTFKEKDELMQKKVAEGKMTDADYSIWRQRQILQNDLYKASVDKMTNTLVKADKAAMAIVNGELPKVVAESYNFGQALGWKAADDAGLSVGTFQIYNAKSVETILRDNPNLLKEVDVPEDEKWNKDHINREITTGIIKGESIPKIANRLARVTNMDKNAATRNARTAMTGAENLGRYETSKNLRDKGIPVDDVWSATHDSRTRESHILLDGTKRDEKTGLFGEGIIITPIRFAGDPNGDPEEIYNCRCRTGIVLQGIDHSQDENLYAEFMKANYPEDYYGEKGVKEQRDAKEQAFQENKATAISPVERQRMKEEQAEPQKTGGSPFTPSEKQIMYEEKIRHESIEKATYFDAEGNALLTATGNREEVEFDPYEFNHKVEQVVWDGEQVDFTHNHPLNEIFSPEDVENLESLENHSCSAVCDNGITYRLIRDQGQSGELVWDEEIKDFKEKNDIKYIAEDYRKEYVSLLDNEPKREDYDSRQEWKEAQDAFYVNEVTPHMEKWLEENAEDHGYIFVKESGESIAQTETEKEQKSSEKNDIVIIQESDFTPAETISEAEQYARDHYVEGGFFTITKHDVSFNGIDLDVANAINKRLTDIYETFDINKLTSLESFGKKDKKHWAGHSDAPMSTSNFGNVGINNVLCKNMDSIEKYHEEGENAFSFVMDNIDSLSDAQRQIAEAYREAGRSLVDGSVEGMITHEIGHHISWTPDVNKDLVAISKDTDWSSYATHISGYANANFNEYIAESFTAYCNGEVDILQPEMREIFDSLRKKK